MLSSLYNFGENKYEYRTKNTRANLGHYNEK
jgi:hypothetical protein